VLYRRFANGTVVDHVHPEGFYFIAPWNILTIYPVRYQVQNHQMEVISNRGLLMKVSLVIRYRPEIEMLGVLHEEVGPDYVKKIVLPEVEAKYRAMLGRHELEDVFSSNNGILQEIMNEALEQVSQRFVQIDNVMVTNIELPPRINKAIEEKLKEQQLAESYVFKLDSEQKEATRRKIEAEGIMTYSRIVNSALNEKVLQWKGLEAASELTKSPNPKVVIIGSGRGNVPVFMDTNK
jgi:regulator of protease activity HflC (stomatin/prohibitin superfamily)